MRTTKRLLVAFVLIAALFVGNAGDASAATAVKSAPQTSFIAPEYHYPTPGNTGQPTIVGAVQQNVWYNIAYDGCTQQVRIGYFYNYGYAEMRYVSGTCAFGGVSRTMVNTLTGQGFHTVPTWSGGIHDVCVVSSSQSGPCVQSGSGSIWNQQPAIANPEPLIGANAVICGAKHNASFPNASYHICLAVSFGLF